MKNRKEKRGLEPWFYTDLPILLPRKQAAKILGVSTASISRAWKVGDLQKVSIPGSNGEPKGYRVPLSSIEDYAAKNGFRLPWDERKAG